MYYYLFGPCDIIYKGQSLGKSYGGIDLSFQRAVSEVKTLCNIKRDEYIEKIQGQINFFEIKEHIVSNSLLFDREPGLLEFNGSNFKFVIYNAYLEYPEKYSMGVNRQKPFIMNFYAFPVEGEDLFKLEKSV